MESLKFVMLKVREWVGERVRVMVVMKRKKKSVMVG